MAEERMETDCSSKESFVQSKRQELRDFKSAERKEHRINALNKNRVALGDIVEDSSFTAEFVVELAKAVKKKALPVEQYQRLLNALIQSEENINSFLKVDNILFALARDLSSTDPTLQLCAANCCCNLALGNGKACTALAKSIAPYLIAKLESLNYPLLEVCVWTIGNLATGSEKAFDILHAQDCFRYVTLLIANCDNVILPSLIYTALHYVRAGFSHLSIAEAIELTKVVVARKISFEDPNYVWLLALLSSMPACNIYLRDVIPITIDCLVTNSRNNFSNVAEVTACVRILANTVSELSGEVAHCFLLNPNHPPEDLGELLNKLLSHQCLHVRKESLWLIGNLYNHECLNVRETTKTFLPLLSVTQAVLSVEQVAKNVNFIRQEVYLR